MLFNSIVFIFAFLPIALAGYWALVAAGGHKPRLIWLAGISLVFYGYWAPKYTLLLIAAMIVNYIIALIMQRSEDKPKARTWLLTLGVTFNVGLLFYFKYFNFFIDNVNHALGSHIVVAHIVLPLAISFFTFQKIALLFDIYRRKVTLGPFFDFVTFVLFFPQLIAGPIVHYSELAPQLAEKANIRGASRNILIGVTIFAMGLFKKTVIADTLALYSSPIFNAVRDGAHLGTGAYWLAASSYTLQIYFDFSGYSDMAIGLARMFGVILPMNFYSPLRASNMAEVWRRWHMTLSRFVQSYIFQPISIPLARWSAEHIRSNFGFLFVSTLVPTFLAMVIIGAWHGAAWNFVVFGAMHGIYIAVYDAWHALTKKRRKKNPQKLPGKIFAHVLTLLCFVVAQVPFRAANLDVTGRFFEAMFGLRGSAMLTGDWTTLVPFGASGLLLTMTLGWLIVLLCPNSHQIMTRIEPVLEWKKWQSQAPAAIRFAWKPTLGWSVLAGTVLFLGIAFISRGTTEFIYFNF